MQKILCLFTIEHNLRAKVNNWVYEDGDEVEQAINIYRNRPYTIKREREIYYSLGPNLLSNEDYIPIEKVQTPSKIEYPTVLHAIGDGWNLLGPPTALKTEEFATSKLLTNWTWWLARKKI